MNHSNANFSATVTPARQAAYRILLRVESGLEFAVNLLHGPALEPLGASDRRLATELVMGVLRWRGDLDFQIETLSGRNLPYFDPEIAEILRLGVYQIRFLCAIPGAAAVTQAVQMVKASGKRSAAGLVNAVLRKCERATFNGLPSGDLQSNSDYVESARRSVPTWLVNRWERRFGPEMTRALVLGSQTVPRACLRVTGDDAGGESVRRELEQAGIQTERGQYSRSALWVNSGSVLGTQARREGRLVFQDEASQLVAELVHPQSGDRVLDLCAAPGVKTGQLAAMLGQGTLVACDRSFRRMRLMGLMGTTRGSSLAQDSGGVRLHRVLLDARRRLPFETAFNRVLVDVPCSGTGTLARNPEIKWRLKPEDLPRLAEMQQEILSSALDALDASGRLVYATCSLEPEENERVIAKALADRPGFRLISGAELVSEFPGMGQLFQPEGYFRTFPGVHPMDGFFAALIVRR